jgi:hypothetical protein
MIPIALISVASRYDRSQPAAALRRVWRARNSAKSRGPHSFEINEPRRFGKKITLARRRKASIRVLMLPLDMKSAFPEFVLAFDFDSDLLLHFFVAPFEKSAGDAKPISQKEGLSN